MLSGLAEPPGVIIGYTIVLPFLNDIIFGIVLATVSEIMIFISIDELIPLARKYGESHFSIYGWIIGMLVMAVSLFMFD